MSNLVDLTDMDFERLHVIERDMSQPHRKGARWVCRCSCGNICTVASTALRSGGTRSCGCLHQEYLEKRRKQKKTGPGPQRAGSGICYNPLCPTRNNYRGAWSCTECRFCPERKFARQSRREIITI